jgi:hypothetical protein
MFTDFNDSRINTGLRMSIIASQKQVRRWVWPLLLLWLFSQSMLLCALGMGKQAHSLMTATFPDAALSDMALSDMAPSYMASHDMMLSAAHHPGAMESTVIKVMDGTVDAFCESGTGLAGQSGFMVVDCSADQETLISVASFYLLGLFLLVLAICRLMPDLNRLSKYLHYWRETPPLFNYPAHHILHCTLRI